MFSGVCSWSVLTQINILWQFVSGCGASVLIPMENRASAFIFSSENMFTLTDITPISTDYHIPIAEIETGLPHGLPLYSAQKADQRESVIVSMPPREEVAEDGFFEFEVEMGSVEVISWGAVRFHPAKNPDNPQPGEFVIFSDGSVIISPRVLIRMYLPPYFFDDDWLWRQSLRVTGRAINIMEEHNQFTNLPSLLAEWNCKNELSWNLSFEGHPTGSFSFWVPFTNLRQVVSQLPPKGALVEMYGYLFQVDTIDGNWVRHTHNAADEVEVSVSLRGGWEAVLLLEIMIEAGSAGGFLSVTSTSTISGDEGVNPGLGGSSLPTPTWTLSDFTFGDGEPRPGLRPTGGRTDFNRAEGNRVFRGKTTVQAMARQIDIAQYFPGLITQAVLSNARCQILGGPPLKVTPPEEEALITTLDKELRDRLRHNGLYVSYSRAEGIELFSWDSPRTHMVSLLDVVEDIQFSFPYFPRAKEYRNTRLDGNFRDEEPEEEDTQGDRDTLKRPQYDQKLEILTLWSGDEWHIEPPRDVTIINDLTQVFDNGGRTKELRSITTQNGTTILESYQKYGFVYDSRDIYFWGTEPVLDPETRQLESVTGWILRPLTTEHDIKLKWQRIEDSVTVYEFDPETGYLDRVVTFGWQIHRFKKESNNEIINLIGERILSEDAPTDDFGNTKRTYDLIKPYEFSAQFSKIPVWDVQHFCRKTFIETYKDVEPRPFTEQEFKNIAFFELFGSGFRKADLGLTEYDRVLRVYDERNPSEPLRTDLDFDDAPFIVCDVLLRTPDPNWVEPEWAKYESRRRYSYRSIPDPDQPTIDEIREGKSPNPDLTTGEDFIELIARFPKQDANPSALPTEIQATEGLEYYAEYKGIANAQNGRFRDYAELSNFTQNKGRPGEHTRLDRGFSERREDEEKGKDKDEPKEPENKPTDAFWLLNSTTEEIPPRIQDGSLSYPYAYTKAELFLAALTDLKIENARETQPIKVTITFRPEIQGGDRVYLERVGNCRVFGVNQKQTILGRVTDSNTPVVPSFTSLDMGLEIECAFRDDLYSIAQPQEPVEPPEEEEPPTPNPDEPPRDITRRQCMPDTLTILGLSRGNIGPSDSAV